MKQQKTGVEEVNFPANHQNTTNICTENATEVPIIHEAVWAVFCLVKYDCNSLSVVIRKICANESFDRCCCEAPFIICTTTVLAM